MVEEAEKLKAEGNTFFKADQPLKAAALFTRAIKLDPENAVLYSNRSAAFRMLGKLKRSLEDAEECVRLRPEWSKGYYRMSLTLYDLERYDDALVALRKGEKVDEGNKDIKMKIGEVERQLKKVRDVQAKENLRRRFSPGKSEADQFLASVMEKLKSEENTGIDITMHFPSSSTIGVDRAFDSPDTLSKCTEHLRLEVKERKQNMACMVVRKRCIAYPQVWTNKQWTFGTSDGFFVQLHSSRRKDQAVFFLPTEGNTATDAYVLPFEQFRFMPDVIVEHLPDV